MSPKWWQQRGEAESEKTSAKITRAAVQTASLKARAEALIDEMRISLDRLEGLLEGAEEVHGATAKLQEEVGALATQTEKAEKADALMEQAEAAREQITRAVQEVEHMPGIDEESKRQAREVADRMKNGGTPLPEGGGG